MDADRDDPQRHPFLRTGDRAPLPRGRQTHTINMEACWTCGRPRTEHATEWKLARFSPRGRAQYEVRPTDAARGGEGA